MSNTLNGRDATLGGQTLQEWSLEFLTERITVCELIRSRVYQEVQDHNRSRPERFRGLIEPEADERLLNGAKPAGPRQLDWHRQFERAVQAFRTKNVLILVNGHQAEDLDEEITIAPGTDVSFLRLTMLTGG